MAENVWTNAGMNVFGKDRDALLTMHPTVKPLPLLVDMIMVTPRRRPPLSPRPVVIYENDRGQSWCVCGQARYGRAYRTFSTDVSMSSRLSRSRRKFGSSRLDKMTLI
jgi:hypothetical protein